MNASHDRRPHLILLDYPGDATLPTSEEMKTIMDRFGRWMERLCSEGRVAATNGLELSGKRLRGPIGQTIITDGPFAEGKEVVGGYVLLNPCTLDEAVAAAGTCPGLDYCMIVEVRPVQLPQAAAR